MKIMLDQSWRPIHCCFVRASIVQPVQFATRPGGTKKSMIPVKAMPIKDTAVNTEIYDRQLNLVFVSSLISLPFYPVLSGTQSVAPFFSPSRILSTETSNRYYFLNAIKYTNTIQYCISSPGKWGKTESKRHVKSQKRAFAAHAYQANNANFGIACANKGLQSLRFGSIFVFLIHHWKEL